jgi:hypothetical protein
MLVTLVLTGCSKSARHATLPPATTSSTTTTDIKVRPSSVDGVKLVPITTLQRSQCANVANETRTSVPCPGLIPNPAPSSLTAASCANAGDFTCGVPQGEASGAPPTPKYFAWSQYAFEVPAGYQGVPGETSANGGPLGHFVIYSAKNLDVARDPRAAPQTVPAYCIAINQHAALLVHGSVAGRMYECSETANAASIELDQGHELLVWREAGVTCEVSFHGHSRTNQDLALAVARSSRMVSPARA